MARFLRKLVVFGGLAIFTVAATLAAMLAWRLSRGPIAVPVVAERLEEAFAEVSSDPSLRVRKAELAWWSRRPVIRVLDAELVGRDGRALGSIPALSVRPSVRAALQGRFTVAWIGLARAQFTLVRTEDGAIEIGAGADAGRSGATELLAALLARRSGDSGPVALPRIQIFDADLVFDDRRTDTYWRAERATIDIGGAPGGLTARLETELTLRGNDKLVGEAMLPLVATVNVARDAGGKVEGVAFEAQAHAGRLVPAADADVPIPLPLHSLDVQGSYARSAGAIEVTRLHAAVGSADVELSARVPRGTPGGVVHVRGEVRSLPAVELVRLWPPARWHKPREWILHNVREGRVTKGRFELNIPSERPPGVRLAAEAVDVAFDFEGLAVRYLDPIEPLREVRGSATLDAERFAGRVESASAGRLAVTNGDVAIHLVPKPAPLDVSLDVAGSVAEMLALLASRPLEIPQKIGISTAGAQGHGNVHAKIHLPLASGITLDDLDIEADADLRDAALAEVTLGVGIARGSLNVRVHNRHVEVGGETELTGALEPDGRVSVAVAVDAPKNADKRVSGVLDAADLHADGDVTIDDAGVRTVSLSRLRLDGTDVAAQLARVTPSSFHASLDGDVLDIEPLLERMGEEREGSSMPDVDWEVDVSVARVLSGFDLPLRDVQANVRGHADDLRVLRASALVGEPDRGSGRHGQAEAPSGVLEIDLAADPAAGSPAPGSSGRAVFAEKDRLTFFSNRAGEVLRALGVHDEIAGGRLSVTAVLDGRSPSRGGSAQVDVDDFRILDAPLLARILGLGSLDGLANLLGGEGIGFTHARVPVSWTPEAIDFRDARAVGAIGVTADGSIDRGSGALDLGGQIIPAYTLNSALGKVPIIGRLLVGGEGKGVFGIEYRVGGNRDSPEISVNPLSALAPGVLRQMFVDPFTPRKAADAQRAPAARSE